MLPYGIYTIPEISTVGLSEAEGLRLPGGVVCGRCHFDQTARGIISGDHGLLKLVVERRSGRLLGAACIGERATDIIHTVMIGLTLGAQAQVFADAVFNYPTISDALKLAARDALAQRDPATAPPTMDLGAVPSAATAVPWSTTAS